MESMFAKMPLFNPADMRYLHKDDAVYNNMNNRTRKSVTGHAN